MISWVGIDISKSNLVVWVQPQGEGFDLPNTPAGFVELIERLSQYEIDRVLLEATGGYECKVMAALQGADFKVLRINPRRARAFAVAMGNAGRHRMAVTSGRGKTVAPTGFVAIRKIPEQPTKLWDRACPR